jgi:hypothetical protein
VFARPSKRAAWQRAEWDVKIPAHWVLQHFASTSITRRAWMTPTPTSCDPVMDKLFPNPELNPALPLVIQVVTDTVIEHGTAEILGVPGDHQAALRKEVRAAVRKRTGHGMETYAHETMVIFVCQPIYDQHELEHARFAAEAMDKVASKLLKGEPVEPMQSPTRLFWATWASD